MTTLMACLFSRVDLHHVRRIYAPRKIGDSSDPISMKIEITTVGAKEMDLVTARMSAI